MKCTPLDYMLAIVSDENAPEHRRDSMAVASAAFVHPKLSAVASVDASNAGNCITTIQFLAVPTGVFLTKEQIANPDLLLEHAVPFEPGTPPTPALAELPAPVAVEPEPASDPLPVEPAPDNGKVTPLAAWRRRD
jgi:hypothetical protein